MSGDYTHNPRLPHPSEVLPLNPRAIMLDGVEAVELGKAVGFWTPKEEHCQTLVKNGTPLVPISRVPEVINQLAGYTLMHGYRYSRIPFLTGGDQIRGLQPIAMGEMVRVTVDVTTGNRNYMARGELRRQLGNLAYSGLIRGVLLEEGETWEDTSADSSITIQKRPKVRIPHEPAYRETRPQELYQCIVDIDRIPKTKPKAGAPKVDLSVESNNHISVNGEVVRVIGHRLFVLNALLLNLGREITRMEVEELGFAEGTKKGVKQANFSLAKCALQRELVVGDPPKPLIRQRFSHTKRGYYQLDPNYEYIFTDKRERQ